DLPPFADVAEAEVLEPHRLEPGEGDVYLRGLDLLPRVLDAGLVVHRLRAYAAGAWAHLVAAGDPHRFCVRGPRLDPRRLARPFLRELAGRDDHRDGTVGRRTCLEIADRIPQHRRLHHVVDRHGLS